jgi:excisionase family DNA binding protein
VKQWYSPKEVAVLHGVKVATVRRWADDGRFPGVRRLPNSSIRIPKEAADAVLSAPSEPAAATVEAPTNVPHLPRVGRRRKEAAGPEDLPNFMNWQAKVRRPS